MGLNIEGVLMKLPTHDKPVIDPEPLYVPMGSAHPTLSQRLIKTYGRQWSVIASQIPSRTAAQVSARWETCINPELTKGNFTPSEDAILAEFVAANGVHAWPKATQVLPHRSAKQCRERWFNNLDPSVAKTAWTPEEDRLIFELYLKFGPKWSAIAPLVEGRTDNSIKNRWNASICHRMEHDIAGNPVLAPSRARKYTRRKPLDAKRPPAIVITPEMPFSEIPSPEVLTMTPVPFGIGSPAFDHGGRDPEFGLRSIGFDSPFDRARIGFQSPVGLEQGFHF